MTFDPFALDDEPASPMTAPEPLPRASGARAAAGRVSVVDLVDVTGMSDEDLSALAAMVAAEQQARAVAAADPAALVELGFAEGFKSNGMPTDPWLVAGVLVCPGSRVDRSATSHDCGWVSVNGAWIWECGDLLEHTLRQLPGPRPQMRAVSLVAAYDGLEVDLVVSRQRAGVHQMQTVRSFVVAGGELRLVQARARRADHNR